MTGIFRQVRSNAQVPEQHGAVVVDKHVRRFDISVNEAIDMQVTEVDNESRYA